MSSEGLGGRAHELNLLSEHPTKLGRICGKRKKHLGLNLPHAYVDFVIARSIPNPHAVVGGYHLTDRCTVGHVSLHLRPLSYKVGETPLLNLARRSQKGRW